MCIEDYKRHIDAQALQSHGKLSPSKELLEKLFVIVVRLDREVYLGVGADHGAGDSHSNELSKTTSANTFNNSSSSNSSRHSLIVQYCKQVSWIELEPTVRSILMNRGMIDSSTPLKFELSPTIRPKRTRQEEHPD